MTKVKIVIHKIIVVPQTVEIDTVCPNCEADLTKYDAIEEGRICDTVSMAHLSTAYAENGDALMPDSADEDADYRGTTFVNCSSCGHHLVEEYNEDASFDVTGAD